MDFADRCAEVSRQAGENACCPRGVIEMLNGFFCFFARNGTLFALLDFPRGVADAREFE